MKAEDLRVAECSNLPSLILRADRMGTILDHSQTVFARDRVKRIKIDRLAREMDGHDRARLCRYCRLQARNIQD